MNILIVVAHPDDEVLMAGGAISKWVGEGHKVNVLWVCENDSLRYGGSTVAEHSQEVADYLGFSYASLEYPDQSLDSCSLVNLADKVADVVRRTVPDLVVTHWEGDLNRDHKVVREAVMVATRPKCDSPRFDLWEGYVPTSSEWAFGQQFSPNLFVDIGTGMASKLCAMKLYKTEVQSKGPRSIDGMEATAKHWGCMVGMAYAEPFRVIRSLK